MAFFLAGCTVPAPLPDPGACAEPPEGVYEYGQIGIGTCLAGPTDLAFLDGDSVLAVSNANTWKDFTGGSVVFLDLDTVDYTAGRNVIAPAEGGDGVAAHALDLPSFAGAMTVAEPHDLLVVTTRLSEGDRTREADDPVWFLDISDPGDPSYADIGPDGPYVDAGYDPIAVHYAASTDLAWVLNRTSHSLAMLDLGVEPVELVPPGGPSRLDAGTFADVDASGSTAGFVTLEATEEAEAGAYTWSLEWGVGTVRAWVGSAAGAYRVTGNGESTWLRSNVPADLDVEDSDGEVLAVNDPSFLVEQTADGDLFSRMVFEDQGVIRAAGATSLENWVFEAEPLLEPSGDGWDTEIGGPSLVIDGATWFLLYDGGSGAEHAIGLATSGDGSTFVRSGAVLSEDGVSLTDPFVIWDEQAALWRMYYTVDGAAIGQATSENLQDWTALEDRFAPDGGASAPAVGYWNGRFHLFYTTTTVDGDVIAEATSLDGQAWGDGAVPFALDADAVPAGGLALQVMPEEAFVLVDQSGETLPATLVPGDTLTAESGGWMVRVAVGQVADPETVDAAGVTLDSVVGDQAFLTYTDDDGGTRIGIGSIVGTDLVLDPEAVLEPGAGGAHDADGVYSPVVAEIDGTFTMYYAAVAADVTTIGRATSPDGVTWTADSAPVLVAEADWETVAIEPGSVNVLEDGTIRLWYTAFDGSRYRVGLAESTDGSTFTRVPGTQYDWVFDAGGPGEWFDTGVRHPWVVRDGDVDRMWFAGDSGDSWQLGYAERAGDDAEWETATTEDGTARPVLEAALGGFGLAGVVRPVVVAEDDGWTLWYTGLDEDQGRVGRAVGSETDRFHRDLRMPSLADTWSFTSVPARDEEYLALDVEVEGSDLMGIGCATIAEDEDRGFLYVGCKLVPYVYVVDVRDDSVGEFEDLNYLDVEAVILVETSTGSDSGLRSLIVDRTRGWLWGVADEPEAIYAIDLANLEDDADSEILRERVVSMLPLPRAIERDEGVSTQSTVGPAQIVLHPDGQHLLVTNYNANSVSAYDLSVGAAGTLVAQTDQIGENPYAIRISSDGTLAAVANFTGEVDAAATSSTIALLDADPESPTFLQVKTWLVNK